MIRAFGAVCFAALTLASGCADKDPPPPPPGVAVIGFVPDYCFWDGYEYVGWYGDQYYYWGPRRVWIICDPVRVEHVSVWMKTHPNQRIPASTQLQPQSQPQVSPPVEPDRHSRPLRPLPDRRRNDHDD